ncbi:MAG TPA: kynureninase [Acidimicrobiales bacterium]|nr:kynureninase [Acidimicrobiales bacterium]
MGTVALTSDRFDRAVFESLDASDELAAFRDRFAIAGDGVVYVDGNSLGRLPLGVSARVAEVVEGEWGRGLVRSWSGWIDLAQDIGERIGLHLIGARQGEVVVSDSTTVNLFKLATAALDARPGRAVIVTDRDNFPSDRYVFEGLVAARGLSLRWIDGDPVEGPRLDDIRAALDDDVALVSLSHVGYRNGAIADMPAITAAAHDAGALTLWDLSHSVGSVPVDLEAAGSDLAVGCTYKYLNGGPGAPAFLYVRRSLQDELRQPIWGWFGQREQFAMGALYDPAPGIGRFLVGTPPVIALAAAGVGVDLAVEAGIDRLRAKAMRATALMLDLFDAWLAPLGFTLATPRLPHLRASHVSVSHPDAWPIVQAMIERGVVPDFREPDVIRLGFAPIYTRFTDTWDAMRAIAEIVEAGEHRTFSAGRHRIT